jgi:ectoine hydroxylase-related dioxygenase (phytanoyl-CoA dioxygenase family)
MMHSQGISAALDDQGFFKVEDILDEEEILTLTKQLPSVNGGLRNLLKLPLVSDLSQNPKLLHYVHSVLGINAFPFRATFFDKQAHANWLVPWHQDLTIPVESQVELPGWGPWSHKNGVLYVQPPPSVLEKVLAVRVNLDHCMQDNGALRVIPKTHQLGRLSTAEITTLRQQISPHTCTVNAGDVLFMRPLLLHASSKAVSPSHRRVIHFEYAAAQLPHPYPKLALA